MDDLLGDFLRDLLILKFGALEDLITVLLIEVVVEVALGSTESIEHLLQ